MDPSPYFAMFFWLVKLEGLEEYFKVMGLRLTRFQGRPWLFKQQKDKENHQLSITFKNYDLLCRCLKNIWEDGLELHSKLSYLPPLRKLKQGQNQSSERSSLDVSTTAGASLELVTKMLSLPRTLCYPF